MGHGPVIRPPSGRHPFAALLRQARDRRALTQAEVARGVRQAARDDGVRSDRTNADSVRRWETGATVPYPGHQRWIAAALGLDLDVLTAAARDQARLRGGGGQSRTGLAIDPDDVPRVEAVAEAVLRLRRSYPTRPPLDLLERVDIRLRQVRQLLDGQSRPSARRNLLEASTWLALLRATVQFDARLHEDAWTSVKAAQVAARDLGHAEIEAWTYETMAWMAATDNRQHHARELASAGISVAPTGGYGLVAATLQRARIHGAMGDRAGTIQDLRAGERTLVAAGDPDFPDDHYAVDPAKARFFTSGAWAQLRQPAETIENASEVVRASEEPRTRNFWPMRVANARVEWAMALTDLGEEDEAAAMAAAALNPLWFRPDTERRMRALLVRMRDPRLRAGPAEQAEPPIP